MRGVQKRFEKAVGRSGVVITVRDPGAVNMTALSDVKAAGME